MKKITSLLFLVGGLILHVTGKKEIALSNGIFPEGKLQIPPAYNVHLGFLNTIQALDFKGINKSDIGSPPCDC